MLYKDVIELVAVTHTTNDYGDPVTQETVRFVFANKVGVRQSEFYQAMQTGLKPELMFEVWTSEYQGEPKLRYEGKDYTIIRTYERPDERTELVCGGLVGE